MKSMFSSTLVIGIGNEFRSDDGVGIFVARATAERKFPGVEVIEQSGEGTALMDAWRKSGYVYLVDAVSSAAPPGAVYRVDARSKELPNDLHPFSSHAFGVAHAIELARRLGTLPPKLILFGIRGKSFESGEGLSAEVERSKLIVTQMIIEEVLSITGQNFKDARLKCTDGIL